MWIQKWLFYIFYEGRNVVWRLQDERSIAVQIWLGFHTTGQARWRNGCIVILSCDGSTRHQTIKSKPFHGMVSALNSIITYNSVVSSWHNYKFRFCIHLTKYLIQSICKNKRMAGITLQLFIFVVDLSRCCCQHVEKIESKVLDQFLDGPSSPISQSPLSSTLSLLDNSRNHC